MQTGNCAKEARYGSSAVTNLTSIRCIVNYFELRGEQEARHNREKSITKTRHRQRYIARIDEFRDRSLMSLNKNDCMDETA